MTKKIKPIKDPVVEGMRAEAIAQRQRVSALVNVNSEYRKKISQLEPEVARLRKEIELLSSRSSRLEKDLDYARAQNQKIRKGIEPEIKRRLTAELQKRLLKGGCDGESD